MHTQCVNVIRKPSGTADQTVGGCSIAPPAMEVHCICVYIANGCNCTENASNALASLASFICSSCSLVPMFCDYNLKAVAMTLLVFLTLW